MELETLYNMMKIYFLGISHRPINNKNKRIYEDIIYLL